jgi:hypothetical protein
MKLCANPEKRRDSANGLAQEHFGEISMARQLRKRTATKSAVRPIEIKAETRRALADDPRVRALRRRRWVHLRALAKDDAFRDETEGVRSDLNAASGFDPTTVDAFMERAGQSCRIYGQPFWN